MRLLVQILLAVFIIIVGIGIYQIYVTPYETILWNVTPVKIYKTIWGKELGGTRFNEHRYQTLRLAVVVVGGLLIFGFFILYKKSEWLVRQIYFLILLIDTHLKSGIKAIRNLGYRQKIFLAICSLIILAFKIYLLGILKLNNDEVRSFNYFVDQGFWIVLTYYPDTNNHIFYNLLCLLPDLFIKDGIMVMRLTALAGNLLLLTFIFIFTLRRFGFNVAMIAISLSSFIWETALFGAVGRGHLWMCLFAFISLWALLRFLETKRNIYLVFVVLFSAIGLFTVPTYLFFLVSVYVFASITLLKGKDYTSFSPLLIAGLVIVIITLLFYLPVILINGMDALTNHRWVQSVGSGRFLSMLPVYLKELPEYMIGLHGHVRRSYIIAALIAIVLFGVYKYLNRNYNEKQWLFMLFIFYLTAVAMVVFLRFFPPYRVFIYYILMWHIAAGILINYIMLRLRLNPSLQMACLIFIFFCCAWIGLESFVL